MVYYSKVLELELGDLCLEPLKEGNLVVVEIRLLEDVKVPLVLFFMSQQVIDVAGNGGLL